MRIQKVSYIYIIVCNICSLSHTDPLPFGKFPPDFINDVESCGDRLVSKAARLVSNKTTNISENFISIRSKMDGGNILIEYNQGLCSIDPWQLHLECNMWLVGQQVSGIKLASNHSYKMSTPKVESENVNLTMPENSVRNITNEG